MWWSCISASGWIPQGNPIMLFHFDPPVFVRSWNKWNPSLGVVWEDLSSLLALILLSSTWILFFWNLRKTRELEDCEALKLTKSEGWSWESLSFLKSDGRWSHGGACPWGRVKLKKDGLGMTSGHWPLPSGIHPSLLLSWSLQSPGEWLSRSFFFL